jgi:hypothetical protein
MWALAHIAYCTTNDANHLALAYLFACRAILNSSGYHCGSCDVEQRTASLALCERIPFWPELRKVLGNSISPATIVQEHAVTAILKLSVVSTCVLPSRRLAATLAVDPEGY